MRIVSVALWVLPCLALQLSGCKDNGQQPERQPDPPTPANLQEPYVVIKDTVMRLAPTEDEIVPVPNVPQRMSTNFIGTISRGHVGTMVERRGYWSHIVLDDDAEGWVKSMDMLPSRQVSEATVLRPVTLYAVPSLKAPPAARINPGDLVFVAEEEGEFSKIYGTDPAPLYVETAMLDTTPNELAMSHMLLRLSKAHSVNDLAEAAEIYDEARISYPKAKLMEVLAENVDFLHTNEVPHTENSRLHRPPAAPPIN